jgi:hypothetical protein
VARYAPPPPPQLDPDGLVTWAAGQLARLEDTIAELQLRRADTSLLVAFLRSRASR